MIRTALMIRVALMSAVLLVATSASAAQHSLAPASGARTEAGNPNGVAQTAGGLHVQVDTGAWTGRPVDQALAPVKVTLTNRSSRPLLVRYDQFALRSTWGDALAPLSPYETAGEPSPALRSAPGRGATGFQVAPWPPTHYGTAGLAAPDDPAYHQEQEVESGGRPTNPDVFDRALPEGILEPGGSVSGFLYFGQQPRGTPVTFVATVVDATTGRAHGDVAIPLTVR